MISGTAMVGAKNMMIVVTTVKSRTRKVAGLRAAGGIRSVIPNRLPELWRGSDMLFSWSNGPSYKRIRGRVTADYLKIDVFERVGVYN